MRGARSSAETQLRRTEAFADSVTDVISKGVLHFINLPLGEGGDPTKVVGSERLLPCLQIMLDGYRKVDPATRKKLPVQSDVPELLVETAFFARFPLPPPARLQRALERSDRNFLDKLNLPRHVRAVLLQG